MDLEIFGTAKKCYIFSHRKWNVVEIGSPILEHHVDLSFIHGNQAGFSRIRNELFDKFFLLRRIFQGVAQKVFHLVFDADFLHVNRQLVQFLELQSFDLLWSHLDTDRHLLLAVLVELGVHVLNLLLDRVALTENKINLE